MVAGLVVAGGYSTRFGLAEKPLVEVGGESMLRRVVRAVASLADEVVIDCRADQVAPFRAALGSLPVDPHFAVDEEADAGPIAGLATGLGAVRRRTGSGTVLVASCDRPGLTTEVLRAIDRCRRRAAVDAVVPTIGGSVQPLCGSYRRSAIEAACSAARDARERRLTRVLDGLSHRTVPAATLCADAATIQSVDTPLEASLHPLSRRSGSDRERPRCGTVVESRRLQRRSVQ